MKFKIKNRKFQKWVKIYFFFNNIIIQNFTNTNVNLILKKKLYFKIYNYYIKITTTLNKFIKKTYSIHFKKILKLKIYINK